MTALPRSARRLLHRLTVPVPHENVETAEQLARRRQVVAATGAVGASLLGLSLSSRPGSPQFYALTGATAATWTGGGLLAGRLHAGRMWAPGGEATQRPVVVPIVSGVATFAAFYAIARWSGHVPVLHRAVDSVLAYADEGSGPGVYAVTVLNGLGEEIFFRGALYAALDGNQQVPVTTLAYTAATGFTRNPALMAAAAVMGTVFGVQRHVTGGLQAPVLTHLTWSTLMLRYLPPLFRRLRRDGQAPPRPRPRPDH